MKLRKDKFETTESYDIEGITLFKIGWTETEVQREAASLMYYFYFWLFWYISDILSAARNGGYSLCSRLRLSTKNLFSSLLSYPKDYMQQNVIRAFKSWNHTFNKRQARCNQIFPIIINNPRRRTKKCDLYVCLIYSAETESHNTIRYTFIQSYHIPRLKVACVYWGKSNL